MPKFVLCLTQMVEEVAEYPIEAVDVEAAAAICRNIEMQVERGLPMNWRAGDDGTRAEVYAILDADRDQVWTR